MNRTSSAASFYYFSFTFAYFMSKGYWSLAANRRLSVHAL